MNVKKIFVTLIIIVACVILGAFLLNILLPNVVKTTINAAEDQLYNATGMKFDFNNDGIVGGSSNNTYSGTLNGSGTEAVDGNAVEGFQ